MAKELIYDIDKLLRSMEFEIFKMAAKMAAKTENHKYLSLYLTYSAVFKVYH